MRKDHSEADTPAAPFPWAAWSCPLATFPLGPMFPFHRWRNRGLGRLYALSLYSDFSIFLELKSGLFLISLILQVCRKLLEYRRAVSWACQQSRLTHPSVHGDDHHKEEKPFKNIWYFWNNTETVTGKIRTFFILFTHILFNFLWSLNYTQEASSLFWASG